MIETRPSLCPAKPNGPEGSKKSQKKFWPSDPRRKLFALKGRILEALDCDPKGKRAFEPFLSTEGRGVRLCSAFEKLKGTKGHMPDRGSPFGRSLQGFCAE